MTSLSKKHQIIFKEIDMSFSSVLAALHSECFSQEERWDEDSFDQLLALPGILGWIAYDDDQSIGLLLGRYVIGEYEVLTLGVRPIRRGYGVGRGLMQLLVKQAIKSKDNIFLEVKKSNKNALYLYFSMGFKKVGHRKAYYSDRSDAIVLKFTSVQ